MKLIPAGSQPSSSGPSDWFTGNVLIDSLLQAQSPSNLNAASVSFQPGTRTAWHTHPLGQLLIVTAGRGRVQTHGGPIHEVRPGDVIWFPPNEKHWHGSAPDSPMTHFAIQRKPQRPRRHLARTRLRRGLQLPTPPLKLHPAEVSPCAAIPVLLLPGGTRPIAKHAIRPRIGIRAAPSCPARPHRKRTKLSGKIDDAFTQPGEGDFQLDLKFITSCRNVRHGSHLTADGDPQI